MTVRTDLADYLPNLERRASLPEGARVVHLDGQHGTVVGVLSRGVPLVRWDGQALEDAVPYQPAVLTREARRAD